MSACAYAWNSSYSACSFLNKLRLNADLLESFDSSFITTEQTNSIRTTLSADIDRVYEECKNDGWGNLRNEKFVGLNQLSAHHAKEFACYIENIQQPNVVPYSNGCIGFEWNSSEKIISIMFKENGNFVYSIITDSVNDYGENKQTSENQQNLLSRISSILLEGVTL